VPMSLVTPPTPISTCGAQRAETAGLWRIRTAHRLTLSVPRILVRHLLLQAEASAATSAGCNRSALPSVTEQAGP